MKETFYKKEIKVHGNVYPSIRQAALYFHLKPQLVWARLKRGKSIDEAFSKVYLKRIGKGKPFSIEGNHFDSIAEAARFYDINESTVRHRLKSGWSRKQAFGIVGRPRKDRIKIKVNNIEYSSLTEAARAHNLAPSIVWQRRRRGCSIEELFSKDCLPLKGKSRTIVVQDKTYPSAKIAAVKFGVHYSKVRWRLKNGWSPEQACGIEERPVKQRRPVSFRGKQHESMSTFARYYEKDPRLIGARLRRGLSIEEALDIKERNYRSKPITCVVKGKKFPSRDAAARHYGFDKYLVSGRMNRLGWTLEQALELVPCPVYDRVEKGEKYIVYSVTNTKAGKQYVGESSCTLEKRRQWHMKQVYGEKRPAEGSLQEAIKRDEPEYFKWKVLARCRSIDQANRLERKFIREFNTSYPHGYNLRRGGTGISKKGKKILVNGKPFDSYRAAADAHGVNIGTFQDRLYAGYSPEQAAGLIPLDKVHPKSRKIKIDNIEYPTIKDAAKAAGQPANRVRNRIHSGWSVEKALKTPFSRRDTPVKIDGTTYSSMGVAARKLGINYDTLRYRLKKQRKNMYV